MGTSTHGRRAWARAAERLAGDIEWAESLLQGWVFTVPSGAAAMPRERGVSVEQLAKAYGGVIGAHVRKNVGDIVDKEAFVVRCGRKGGGEVWGERFGF